MRWSLPAAIALSLMSGAAQVVDAGIRQTRFAPVEDEYYYLAMLDETDGAYLAARAQWAMYAAVPGAPWRHRALEHIAALDAQRRAAPAKARPATPAKAQK